MALYTLKSQRDVANMLNAPKYNPNSQVVYNAIGRDAGSQNNDNFFTKRAKSVGNAVGTTGAAVASFFKDNAENMSRDIDYKEAKNRMNDIAKGYGYDTFNDWSEAYAKATEAGDTAKIKQFEEQNEAFKKQSDANHEMMTKKAADYRDWMENNDVSKYIQQDRGKFAGSAMNTLSTGFDVLSMAAGIPNGPVVNGIQGAWEGVADELEQNGLENFDLGRAGQNAAIGAASGAATGALNKTGVMQNLGKGKITQALLNTKAGEKVLNSGIGQGVRALGTGAVRGAISGAVGGATGAGLSAAMNNQDVIQSALQGAERGAKSGAVTGGIMAGANLATNAALNKVAPNMMEKVRANQARNAEYGDTLRNQFKGAWNSGDSVVAENILKPMASKVDNFVDNTRTRIVNRNAIDRLTKSLDSAMEGGAKGNTKFVRIGNDLLDDLNNIRSENGLEPLTSRQVTAYENAINNNLTNRVKEGMSTSDVALMAFNALTSDNSKAVPGYYNNQLVVSEPGMVNDYDGTVLGLAKDGGTSLKSIEPRNRSQIEMLEENGQQKMGPKSRLGSSPAEEQPVNSSIVSQNKQNVNQETEVYRTPTGGNSQWDNIAQEAGYRTYDEAVQRFMEANPNAKVDAGSVLTWLDNNQGGWNPNMPRQTVESPETEMYRRLSGEGEELPKVFEPEARNTMQSRNKLQSVGEQLRNSAKTQKYGALYDSLDGKTAARAVQTGAPQALSELGVSPENYLEAAKTSNYVNKVVSDLADESGVKVTVPDMTSRLESATDNVILTENAAKKYNNIVKQIVADGNTPDEYSAGYLLQKSREIGNKAANLRGNTDDVNTLRAALTDAKYTLRDIATEALEDAGVTGTEASANIAKGLAQMGANQKIQDYYTEPIDGKAPTASDLIRKSALFEQARDMGTQVEAEKYTRSASKAATNPLTKIWNASGLDQPVNTLLRNTVAPVAGALTDLAGRAVEGAGNLVAKVGGNAPTASGTTTTTTNAYSPATQVYNAIGRNEGLTNGEQARTAGYLADAVNQNNAMVGNGTLESLVSTPGVDGSTSVYNSVYGNQPATMASNQSTGHFQPTGDYWTDILATAMSSAIDADDADAFVALYEMYQDALSKQQSTSTSSQKLTATQQRANAAMDSLQRLANMTPDLGYNLSNIPGIGKLATLGGNDYEGEATSLAQQIGYMVSGANIKESEAENIGKSYVPQPWDSEQTRQNKLRRAYETILRYQNGYTTE